jgi:hypothetical protein
MTPNLLALSKLWIKDESSRLVQDDGSPVPAVGQFPAFPGHARAVPI